MKILIFRTIKFGNSERKRIVVEEEIVEEAPDEKKQKLENDKMSENHSKAGDSSSLIQWKVTNSKPVKKSKMLLVKPKGKMEETKCSNVTEPKSALSLLADYSDSDNSDT